MQRNVPISSAVSTDPAKCRLPLYRRGLEFMPDEALAEDPDGLGPLGLLVQGPDSESSVSDRY